MRMNRTAKRLLLGGGVVTAALTLSMGTAFASTGTYYTSGSATPDGCVAALDMYSSSYGYGEVWAGSSSCTVDIQQRNISTGGYGTPQYNTAPAGGYVTVGNMYHGDGIHQLQVCMYDAYYNGGCTGWIG